MELRPTKQIRPFPNFHRPEIEGAFSVDSNRSYEDSFEKLKYMKIPSVIDFNLNDGDEDYVDKSICPEDEKIKHLLGFVMKNVKKISRPDFIAFRGLLRMIMSTPYEPREPWNILATRYKGTIFLCNEETQRKKAERMNRTEKDKKFLRYGFKFERYLYSDHPAKDPPGNSEPVIESEEFCIMFRTEIDGKRILYGAEIDGVLSDGTEVSSIEHLRKSTLTEVKVKRREQNANQLRNFYRFKARNWWLQSFLVGIDNIHYGVRNDDGIVEEVKSVSMKELSDEAKKNNYWHGTVAMNFLNDFLKKLSKDMKNIDNPNVVYKYKYDTESSDFITFNKLEGHRFRFLDDDFVTFMETL